MSALAVSSGGVEVKAPRGWRSLLARVGVAGFLFFFLKGLAWLIVPAVLVALRAG